MGKLYLNTVDDRFDPETDRLIGPWCLIGSRWIDEDWSRFDFIEPFENSEEEALAADGCAELIRFHLTRLCKELNLLHQETRDFAFWWTLLTPWLQHLVEASWRNWVHTEKFVSRHDLEKLTFDVFATQRDFNFNFADTRDFVYRGLRSPDFMSLMITDFIIDLAPDSWRQTPVQALDLADREGQIITPPDKTNTIKRMARRFLGRLPVQHLPGISLSSIPLSIYVNLLPRKEGAVVFRVEPTSNVPDGFPPAYLRALDLLIAQTIPRSFTIDFRAYNERAAALHYHPKRLFVTAPTIFEDQRCFEIAHAIAAGERVVRMQHGSEYGIAEAFNNGWMNEYVNAAFLSWGWTKHRNLPGRFFPVSSPMLARLRNRYKCQTSEIILVGTSAILVPYRIDSAQKPSKMAGYRSDKLTFIRGLEAGSRRNLRYRPYKRGHTELPDETWLEKNAGPLIIHDGSLHSSLLKCRLAVLDHPGTTLHITMAANIPTVCFWRHGLFAPSAEQKPVFDLLKSAGILHDAPESAAAHVNRIAADVGAWWYDEKTQQARRIWSAQHARTDRIWWWSWLTALARI